MTKSKLWGGRFNKATNKLVENFSSSIHFDQKLAEYDCIGSLIHIEILKKAGLLKSQEYTQLKKGLRKILSKVQKGQFKIDPSFEDIHSYMQHVLEKDKSVGNAALKLHTCRSRNDQVVFDTKLYAVYNIFTTNSLVASLMRSLHQLAQKNKQIYLPGYTHLQHAMPISLVEYFDAYCAMLLRDCDRLRCAFNNISITLGAGALAGTFIDAEKYVQAADRFLQEKGIIINATNNSIDAVSDRDFIVEILSTLSIIGMHLSRLAEDMILWASSEFDFIDIDDAFCTGSSLMPQKKNPDVLELVRGYTGRLYGNLVNALVMMKGLPLSYNRDMQLDKEPLFDSFKIIQDELALLTELFKNIRLKEDPIKKQLDDECLYATDMADYLVKKGIAFKTAHSLIGKLIQEKFKTKTDIRKMDDAKLKSIHPLLTAKVLKSIINPRTSVAAKKSVKKGKRKY